LETKTSGHITTEHCKSQEQIKFISPKFDTFHL